MELGYQQKKALLVHHKDKTGSAKWLTAVGALTSHFVAETSAIDNAKALDLRNFHTLVANHLFCHELRYFENIMKEFLSTV